mmetsp:Transcript_39946/g.116569  ORF Transcript_39946/g.116569 Transcript_39946/m.116569 type:complete len:90 (-) Transcript_39946:43-312(-)|eukprot:367656-Prymnesium_polylepis.2
MWVHDELLSGRAVEARSSERRCMSGRRIARDGMHGAFALCGPTQSKKKIQRPLWSELHVWIVPMFMRGVVHAAMLDLMVVRRAAERVAC